MSYVTHLECSLSGRQYPAGQVHRLSAEGRPLLVRYDLERLAREADRNDWQRVHQEGFWGFRELLPLDASTEIPWLGETLTPLIPLTNSHGPQVQVKDEGRLPTASFKARGLGLAVAMARQLGLDRLAMPSNGNAGAALAAYATRAGMQSLVYCPADTPTINIDETRMAGAEVVLVDGYIDDCGALLRERAEKEGWFDVSTLKEPYRLEGKKTMGLELAMQFGWKLPEVIFYPTGGGTGLIGMWKAFDELRQLGWLESEQLPRMVAVQAAGCAPMVRAYERGEQFAQRWEDASTMAAGIRVPAAVGDFLILRAVRESNGTAIAVTEAAISQAWTDMARNEGVILCPEGAATYAAYRQLLEEGWLDEQASVVLFNCASGLKYPLSAA
ncbi:MAG: threonine synthase [Wenzhouxiangellaceae bacterium]